MRWFINYYHSKYNMWNQYHNHKFLFKKWGLSLKFTRRSRTKQKSLLKDQEKSNESLWYNIDTINHTAYKFQLDHSRLKQIKQSPTDVPPTSSFQFLKRKVQISTFLTIHFSYINSLPEIKQHIANNLGNLNLKWQFGNFGENKKT